MAWTPTGRYVEDVYTPAMRTADNPAASITPQTQQLSGLLGTATAPVSKTTTPGRVTDLPNPSVPTVNSGARTVTLPNGSTVIAPSPTSTSDAANLVRVLTGHPQGGGGTAPGATGGTTPPPTNPKTTTPGTVTDLPNPSVPTVGGTTTPPPATGGSGTPTTPAPTPSPTTTPAPNPATPPVPAFTPPPPTPVPPGPSSTPPPSNFTLPSAPTPQDASVETQLNGLLSSNSPYIAQARLAGQRQANARGLLNSSIAAGNSEAAAIAAAAPIASQDAQQIAQRNITALEGWNQLRSATTVQQLSDNAAWQRTAAQLTNALDLQGMSDTSAMSRLIAQGNIQAAIQQMQDSNALTQTQINANVQLIGNYMNAFSALAQNPDVPASARDAYMAEYLRVTQQGQALTNALAGITVTWPGAGPGGTVGNPPSPVQGGNFYNGPSKEEIMAMQHDGVKGNFAAAVQKWNQFHPDDPISTGSSSGGGGSNPLNALFGITGLLAKPFG